jgi:hypothetical protein
LHSTVLSVIIEISRFFFVLLALYILLRVVDNSLQEFSARRRMKQNMQRFFGDLTVVEARNGKLVGKRYGLKWENSLGCAARCDVRVTGGGLIKEHAVLYLSRDSAFVRPAGKATVWVEGRRANKRTEVFDGDSIQLGETLFVLRLFEEERQP